MGYWEDSKVQENFSNWEAFYNGCVMCACDHGCNQWVDEQISKTKLILKISQEGGDLSLDTIAKMMPEEADKLWKKTVDSKYDWVSLRENNPKVGLMLHTLVSKGNTKPEKVLNMEEGRAYSIWYRIVMWQAERFNRDLRNVEKLAKELKPVISKILENSNNLEEALNKVIQNKEGKYPADFVSEVIKYESKLLDPRWVNFDKKENT